MIFTANTGLCVDDIAQHVPAVANQIPSKPANGLQLTVSKFIVTMLGVIFSSIVIWGGLTIYNKFFVKENFKPLDPEGDTLSTPKTVEDAVVFFIKRNKL